MSNTPALGSTPPSPPRVLTQQAPAGSGTVAENATPTQREVFDRQGDDRQVISPSDPRTHTFTPAAEAPVAPRVPDTQVFLVDSQGGVTVPSGFTPPSRATHRTVETAPSTDAAPLHEAAATVLGATVQTEAAIPPKTAALDGLTSGPKTDPANGASAQNVASGLDDAKHQGSTSDVPPQGAPTVIAERGASIDPTYKGMADFAAQNGSVDGTPIVGKSTYDQDKYHFGAAKQATNNAIQNMMYVRSNPQLMSPQEAQVLQHLESMYPQTGFQPMSTPDLMARRDILQMAYDKGMLPKGTPLAKAFGSLCQTLEMQGKIEANATLKWANLRGPNSQPPFVAPNMRMFFDQSPYAKARQAAADPSSRAADPTVPPPLPRFNRAAPPPAPGNRSSSAPVFGNVLQSLADQLRRSADRISAVAARNQGTGPGGTPPDLKTAAPNEAASRPAPASQVSTHVHQGDIAQIPADAMLAPINSAGMWFGAIDGVIDRADPSFHAQAEKGTLVDGSHIYAKGSSQNKGAFNDVLFMVDDGQRSASDLVYQGLKDADARGLKSVSIPALRLGVAGGGSEGREGTISGLAQGVKRFQAENPQSLRDIHFAIYRDPQTAQDLERALQS